MVSFWVYDVAFLVLFCVGVFFFLRGRREELAREGIMFIWRTKFGIDAISWFAKRFGGVLKRLRGLIIALGFLLMGVMVWMLSRSALVYLLNPEIMQITKAPPIAPLIPYFPKLFGMESLFPPFYFTYFLVALAVVAIAHEFSHGVFMKLFRIKIKATGLVFLGPILGAFVEQSEVSMKKASRLNQMTVLGAGVFANVLMAILFYLLYVGFFFLSFSASGYIFSTYAYESVPVNSIVGFEDAGNLTRVVTIDGNYYLSGGVDFSLDGVDYLTVYSDAPAVKAQMKGAIVEADGVKILNVDSLREFLESVEPGDEVRFVTEDDEGRVEYDVVLGEHPDREGVAYLGVASSEVRADSVVQKFLLTLVSFKDSSTYYKPTWDGELVYFIYHLLWWVMVINLLVALFNMLPLGMLDGGRFFYLGVWGITGKEKLGKIAYKIATYFILFLFVLMMGFWFVRL